RGLDYYTKTVFEIVSGMPGAQGTLCGGGRYDGLIKELGGPEMPAVGFGLGMERLLLIMDQLGVVIKKPVRYDVMLIGLGKEAKDRCYVLAKELRARGVSVDFDLMDRSVKAQMKYADKTGALYTLVIGEEELNEGAANLKSMMNGGSILVKLDAAAIADMIVKEG
ncbi:MAG: ATP phosphoribosyltransferase regulatory subunit, partial [Clostridia bacterium]|nr:ATP phosphoribosyltransferase regulatory subunit [Clostridia bacterium]